MTFPFRNPIHLVYRIAQRNKATFYLIPIVSLGLTVGISSPVRGQLNGLVHTLLDTNHTSYNRRYVEDQSRYFTPRIFLVNKALLPYLHYDGLPFSQVDYAPNSPLNVGFGAYYGSFGLNLSFESGLIKPSDPSKGLTKAFDVQSSFFRPNLTIDAYYQDYRGFYINNPRAIDPNWTRAEGYPIRADLRTLSLGVNVYYVFNSKRYSFRSSYTLTERQKRSAGSFMLLPSLSYFNIKGDSSLTPGLKNITHPADYALTGGTFVTLGLAPGYMHTFVVHRFYLTAGAFWGPALGYLHYTSSEQAPTTTVRLNLRLILRGSLGYNGKYYFCGVGAVVDEYSLRFGDNLLLDYVVANTRVFVGRRFDLRKHKA